jgi:hypothetical protein
MRELIFYVNGIKANTLLPLGIKFNFSLFPFHKDALLFYFILPTPKQIMMSISQNKFNISNILYPNSIFLPQIKCLNAETSMDNTFLEIKLYLSFLKPRKING